MPTIPTSFFRPWLSSLFIASCTLASQASDAEKPNVLFIAIDDLRNDIGALGVGYAKTPHLDALAADSRLFSRHYVQVPTCGASRRALLSGQYPATPEHVKNTAILKTQSEWGARSLPAWFRKHGYTTLAVGKVSHYPGGLAGNGWAEPPEELPGAWDRCWIPDSPWENARSMMHGFANGIPREPGVSPVSEAFEGPDSSYPDWWVARDAMDTIETLAASDAPWFFAVGFFKPHLPFAAPQKWHALHASNEIPAPSNHERPTDPSSWHGSGEFRNQYNHGGRDPNSDPEYALAMRRAYAAATSYADAQFGRFIEKAQVTGALDNTIVVVWGDHGFLLGEHAIWGKHCLYEDALRSPLMIRPPNINRPGTISNALVETVDIFPTLIELCGLPKPTGLDGTSLVPQINDPNSPTEKPALGFYNRGQRTIRTDRWRLIVHPPTAERDEPAYELFELGESRIDQENVAALHPEIIADLVAGLK